MGLQGIIQFNMFAYFLDVFIAKRIDLKVGQESLYKFKVNKIIVISTPNFCLFSKAFHSMFL